MKNPFKHEQAQQNPPVERQHHGFTELTDTDLAHVQGGFSEEDHSFDIQQVLNIGSQSTGAGAGKVGFHP